MSKNWIEEAIKNPGSLSSFAKKKGAVTKEGTIKKEFINKEAKSGTPLMKKRANLAKTLSSFKKK